MQFFNEHFCSVSVWIDEKDSNSVSENNNSNSNESTLNGRKHEAIYSPEGPCLVRLLCEGYFNGVPEVFELF